eukprot:6332230-Prymnesium_polylepis.1
MAPYVLKLVEAEGKVPPGLPTRLAFEGSPAAIRLGRPSDSDSEAAAWQSARVCHPGVSRKHATITLVDGQKDSVLLTQHGQNGSSVRPSAADAWTKIPKDASINLAVGALITFGPLALGEKRQRNP